MTKKLIYLSISFTALALILVITFQVIWYNNALMLKTELYEKSVHEALREVVTALERREASKVITNNLEFFKIVGPDSVKNLGVKNANVKLEKQPQARLLELNQQERASKQNQQLKQTNSLLPIHGDKILAKDIDKKETGLHPKVNNAVIFSDSGNVWIVSDSLVAIKPNDFYDSSRIRKQHYTMVYPGISQDDKKQLDEIKNAQEINAKVLSRYYRVADSIRLVALEMGNNLPYPEAIPLAPLLSGVNHLQEAVLNVAQANKILVTIDTKYKNNDQLRHSKSPNQEMDNVIEHGANQSPTLVKQQLNEVLDKLVQEMIDKETVQKKQVNADTLKKIISEALHQQGINEEFAFTVKTDSTTLRLDSTGIKSYHVALFPHDVWNNATTLQLFIPGKEKQISRSMVPHLVGSVLFTCLILLTFAYTIYVMLKQKKMADIKNDFINNMTHEFKTPIATISLATETINNQQTISNVERVRYYTQLIKEENQRMNSQVEKVLQLAISDKSSFELTLDECSFHEIVQGVIEQFQLVLNAENRTILLHFDAENDKIHADKFHLTNAVANVLDNAIKYANPNTNITITTHQTNSTLVLRIRDEGIGMTKEVQRKVFDKFYRAQQGNLHDVKGFGIGLSYVKNIMDAHRGSIALQSSPGNGTTVIITLNRKLI